MKKDINTLNNRTLRLICSLFIAILLSVILLVASYLEPSGFSFWILVLTTLLLFLTWEYAEWVSKKLDNKMPWTGGFTKRLFIQYFYISAGAFAIFVLPYSIYKGYSIAFLEVPVENFAEYLLFLAAMLGSFLLILSFLVTGLQLGFSFMEKWKTSQIIAEKLKRETIKAQLESIRNQIDPHFLFNNFNTLYGLIEEDSKLAKEYLLELSEIYRYILQNKDEEVVTLATEIDIAKSYMFLMKNRYAEAIHIEWQININESVHYLPPLTLQMLLENAIKHNSIEEENPLQVTISAENDGYIEVKNNLRKRTDILSTRLGLDNLKQRIHYLSDKPLEIIELENMFTVRVPLLRVKK